MDDEKKPEIQEDEFYPHPPLEDEQVIAFLNDGVPVDLPAIKENE